MTNEFAEPPTMLHAAEDGTFAALVTKPFAFTVTLEYEPGTTPEFAKVNGILVVPKPVASPKIQMF